MKNLSVCMTLDSAYDAPESRELLAKLNHLAIIDCNKNRSEAKGFEPVRMPRYNERSAVERVDSNFKNNYVATMHFIVSIRCFMCAHVMGERLHF
jgi:hypothetical protein